MGISGKGSIKEMTVNERINALRELMEKEGMNAYLVNSFDPHRSEYTAPRFKAREFMSGFTGSAGTLLVTNDTALLWTDGRYFLQAGEELKGTEITLMKQGEKGVPDIEKYISENIRGILGADGSTVSCKFLEKLKKAAPLLEYKLDKDLVAEIWTDRPLPEHTPVWVLSEEYTGESAADKLKRLREKLDGSTLVLSSLDEIAWLFNIRASDVAYNPVVLSYALILPDHGEIFLDGAAYDDDILKYFGSLGVRIYPYENNAFVKRLKDPELREGLKKVTADPDTVNAVIMAVLEERAEELKKETSPIISFKAEKNPTECENIRKAHITDGVAVTKMIYFLKNADSDTIRSMDELSAARRLDEFRQQGEGYLYQSFEPISAYGEHGAIVHYSADEKTNKKLDTEGFILLDTGGQYLSGTTDITRTVALGELSLEEKQAYTAVLKGNLRLAAAVFKKGCTGLNLDILARTPLWENGLDYNHGTGHGVGFCLNVHEGPQGIRMRDTSPAPFAEGMLTSDEPGVYLEGKFGIRLENLMLCVPASEGFLKFETVTLVPFDRSAILPEEMTAEDRALLDAYHQRVFEEISPFLTEDEREWLRKETAPIDQ